MSTEPTYIDRRGATRTRPMEVLCLGVGRTGTDSTRVALKILGYDDCYHGYSCLHENPPDNYLWLEAADAKFRGRGPEFTRRDWDSLLGHCAAVSDLPPAAFAPELIDTYPEAKVVLTLPPRGVDAWYDSTVRTTMVLKEDWRRDIWAWFDHEAWLIRHTTLRIFDDFYEDDYRQNARRRFDEHYAMIRDIVPSEKLLEYSVTDGWEPLCKFLDKPVPNVPFPSGNTTQAFFSRFAAADRRRRRRVLQNVVTLAAGTTAVVLALISLSVRQYTRQFMASAMSLLR